MPEAIVFADIRSGTYRKVGPKWVSAGSISGAQTCGYSSKEMLALLKKAELRTVAARWQRLQIGDRIFTVSD